MWKQHLTVELLLDFAGPMKPDDVHVAVRRLETVHAATYEDLKRVEQKLAERHEDTVGQA